MIFIFPTAMEAQRFVAQSPLSKVEISGVGLAACGATVARVVRENPDEVIILAGIAGSYGRELADLCEVVEVTEERIEELPMQFQQIYTNKPYFKGLKCVTSNSVSSSAHTSHTSHIENMEGAALFATCHALGVRCSQIRATSNFVGEPFSMWRIEEALEALTQKLMELTR